jgi:bifunctional non-homologous end joining protein LigD
LKEKLAAAGLESFPKVSGSKGIQVYAPLNTAVSFEQTRPYAKRLAEELEREHPGRIVSAMAKSLRHNKVFIDWSQNSDFKTTVAVYSLRAKSTTPYASMPVRWEELRAALKKQDAKGLFFDPESALQRLERVGDLFQPVLTTKRKVTAKGAA